LWRSGGHREADGYELDLVTTHRGSPIVVILVTPDDV
jgi:hypothetical protein